ncbi:MAG: hypothetical protein V3V01_07165 [Acidimicrobiales bacterium]
MGDIESSSVIRGALFAALITVPTAIVMLLIADASSDDGSSLVFLFLGVILMGFCYGGYRAAQDITTTPLTHSAMAALLAYVVIQGVGITRRTLAGDDISWLGLIFNGLLASSFGMVGGFIAQIRNNRKRPSS